MCLFQRPNLKKKTFLHSRVVVTFVSKEGEVALVAGWWRQKTRCWSLDSRWQIQARPFFITEWWCKRVLHGRILQISADYTYGGASVPCKHHLGSSRNISWLMWARLTSPKGFPQAYIDCKKRVIELMIGISICLTSWFFPRPLLQRTLSYSNNFSLLCIQACWIWMHWTRNSPISDATTRLYVYCSLAHIVTKFKHTHAYLKLSEEQPKHPSFRNLK